MQGLIGRRTRPSQAERLQCLVPWISGSPPLPYRRIGVKAGWPASLTPGGNAGHIPHLLRGSRARGRASACRRWNKVPLVGSGGLDDGPDSLSGSTLQNPGAGSPLSWNTPVRTTYVSGGGQRGTRGARSRSRPRRPLAVPLGKTYQEWRRRCPDLGAPPSRRHHQWT